MKTFAAANSKQTGYTLMGKGMLKSKSIVWKHLCQAL